MLAAAFPGVGIGFLGVALAFGLTVLTMAYAIGHISGCHLNPAVTLGLWAGKRFPAKDILPYIVAQVLGGIAGAAVLWVIVGAAARPSASREASPPTATAPIHRAATALVAALVCECVMTFMFLMVILGSTDERAPKGLAPVAIGLCLTLIHLVSIPVTNTSVNPARSTGPAIFVGGWALEQLWLFWLAPIAGALLAGICYRPLAKGKGLKGSACDLRLRVASRGRRPVRQCSPDLIRTS